MAVYIEREAICYQLEKQESIDGQPRAIRRARRIVADFPTADVVPVRHARWLPAQDYSNGNEDIECSSCGEWFKSLELCGRLGEPNYCPVCGAKMDGSEEVR